ncbi:MAG TPA: Rieske 2Fe-2S domain-containing protein [Steroidobacteraceae bacterium]|nr:Rieske 2Fe-2S domain-containing protein [Steroidobacteraceae bacterium]
MSDRQPELDLARVICSAAELREGECRGFTVGAGDWPVHGLILRLKDRVHAFVNRCPHAGHPLNLRPHDFLTADGALLLCHSHGALFDRESGLCIAGPCAGAVLQPLPLERIGEWVLLAAQAQADAAG